MSMNYANIKYYDIANGPGVRTSVFVSGCRHHCPGCFNAVAWDFDYGQPFDKTVRNEVFASCQPDYIAGLSLLGGEPFEPENQRELLPLLEQIVQQGKKLLIIAEDIEGEALTTIILNNLRGTFK